MKLLGYFRNATNQVTDSYKGLSGAWLVEKQGELWAYYGWTRELRYFAPLDQLNYWYESGLILKA